jgi:hypothetical protein
LYGFIGASSVKSLVVVQVDRTVPAAGSYRTPHESVVSPSRFASPAASPPAVYGLLEVLISYDPAGAVQVRPL